MKKAIQLSCCSIVNNNKTSKYEVKLLNQKTLTECRVTIEIQDTPDKIVSIAETKDMKDFETAAVIGKLLLNFDSLKVSGQHVKQDIILGDKIVTIKVRHFGTTTLMCYN